MSKERTDPHRPSVLDPADYVFVGASDQAEYWGEADYFEMNHNRLREYGVETTNRNRHSADQVPFYNANEDGRPNYRCHHCGKHGTNIRYFCFFLHKPSLRVITVGKVCAKKLDLASKADLDFEKRAKAWRRESSDTPWIVAHPDEVAFLDEYRVQRENGGIYHDFLHSLSDGLKHYGRLTDRQLEALQRIMAKGLPWKRVQPRPQIDGDRHQGQVVQTQAEPTEAQLALIAKLSERTDAAGSFNAPTTRIEASDLINALKALQQEQRPAPEPATQPQISFINSLMDERVIPLEKRRTARKQLDAGITKSQASRWIEALRALPVQEDV